MLAGTLVITSDTIKQHLQTSSHHWKYVPVCGTVPSAQPLDFLAKRSLGFSERSLRLKARLV